MRIETFEQRILIAKEGNYWHNTVENIVSTDNKVYLGKEADAFLWVEITEEEKQKIEAEQTEADEQLSAK